MKKKTILMPSLHDARPVVEPLPKPREDFVPPGRIAVLDRYGRRRGHVSAKTGTEATCARFGVPNAELTTVNGERVWKGRPV